MKKYLKLFIFSTLAIVGVFLFSKNADAANLSVSPANGTFEVGSTFEVSIFLNTQGQEINTVVAQLQYPPDKLQIVSSGSGTSIIKFWTTPPQFNNSMGFLQLSGGIPNGINTSNGLVATLTFRVKKTGTAAVRFIGDTQTYLNDGNGTKSLSNTFSGVYNFVLPPPEGPIVASSSHPDQNIWYTNPNIVFSWETEFEDDGYSYMLSESPSDIPDDISEGNRTSVTYTNTADGSQYFHIKALRNGTWGGVTHYAVNVDTTQPAEFPIKINPSARTTNLRPAIEWGTTDGSSGIDFYEIKIVALTPGVETGTEQLFIEAASPYIPDKLSIGDYDVIVRAHDKAGNTRAVTERLEIVKPIFSFLSEDGITVNGKVVLPWGWLFSLLFLMLAILGVAAWLFYKRHQEAHQRIQTSAGNVPPEVGQKLDELKKYQDKYGKMMVLVLLAASLMFGAPALSQNGSSEEVEGSVGLNPPIVENVSTDINNEEIFYVGGVADVRDSQVIIYLQNLHTGETISRTIEVKEDRTWFYRHNNFLAQGPYLLWAQSKLGEQTSPPTAQIQLQVSATAFQFGASRISHEILYLILSSILLIAVSGLSAFTMHHRKHAKRKHASVMQEIQEAEESIRRGFALLRKDIQAELEIIKMAKLNKTLSREQEEKEKQMMEDLEDIENKIGKEVWDIRRKEDS